MRNPKRIDYTLELISELWKQNPDWRLGQLLMNVSRNEDGSVLDANEIWNLEDDALIKLLLDEIYKDYWS